MKTLEQMVRELAALPAETDVPLSWTQRQLDDLRQQQGTLMNRIQVAHRSVGILAEVDPQIAALIKWRDHLVRWRQLLCDRLAALPPPRTGPELGERQKLEMSIQRIDYGLDLGPAGSCMYGNIPLDDLMREAGYVPRDAVARADGEAWFGTLPSAEWRLKELQARHDDAKCRLDEALLGDKERAKRDAQIQARDAEAATRPRRKTRPDGTQYDKYPDGRCVEVTG